MGLSLQVTLAEFLILLRVKNEQPVTFKHTSALSQTQKCDVSTNGNHITHFNTKIDPNASDKSNFAHTPDSLCWYRLNCNDNLLTLRTELAQCSLRVLALLH